MSSPSIIAGALERLIRPVPPKDLEIYSSVAAPLLDARASTVAVTDPRRRSGEIDGKETQ